MEVFVSVGSGLSQNQEAFVTAVEARLRAEGFTPRTLNRNEWSVEAPMAAINRLMDRCSGAMILGLERYYFPDGIERRGSDRQGPIRDVALATPWNQIEATLAHSRNLPLFVIVDENVRADGLLEKGYDWTVAVLPIDPNALRSDQFNGMMRSWREKMTAQNVEATSTVAVPTGLDPAKLTVQQLLGALKPAELLAVVALLFALLTGAFAAGARFPWFAEKPAEATARSAVIVGHKPAPAQQRP